VITGLDSLNNELIFHAGTTSDDEHTYTNGGRVLAVTSIASSPERALENSYACLSKIDFEGIYFRKDIGKDLINVSDSISG